MMCNDGQMARYALDALLKAGADKAQSSVRRTVRREINVEGAEINLMRTAFNVDTGLMVIKDNRKGSIGLNRSDRSAIDDAVTDVMDIASASEQDDAYDIAAAQPPGRFTTGDEEPDLEGMYTRLESFLNTVKARYPKVVLRQVFFDFTHSKRYFLNSNGVDFQTSRGIYRCMIIFSSRDGEKVSSFNYTGASMKDLEKELVDCGSIDTLLRQSAEQVETTPISGKFVGDIVVAPDCLDTFLWILTGSLGDGAIISGTSVYKDSLGEMIACPQFSLHSRPVSDEIADGYFITSDGYAAQNSTIIDHGVLKTFLLSLYGSRKAGRERAVNNGGAYVIDPGDKSLEDMISSIEKGILLTRFSGGNPSSNGDFSGVAKNSYLIEDGKIRYPVSETMVSGNFAEAFKEINGISRERVDYGHAILPWVSMPGMTISGK